MPSTPVSTTKYPVSTTEYPCENYTNPCADARTAPHSRSDAMSAGGAVTDITHADAHTPHAHLFAHARVAHGDRRRRGEPVPADVRWGYTRGVLTRGLNSRVLTTKLNSRVLTRGLWKVLTREHTGYAQGTHRNSTGTRVLTGYSRGRPEPAGGALHTTGRYSPAPIYKWRPPAMPLAPAPLFSQRRLFMAASGRAIYISAHPALMTRPERIASIVVYLQPRAPL